MIGYEEQAAVMAMEPDYETPFGDPDFHPSPHRSRSWSGAVPPNLDSHEPSTALMGWLSVVDPDTLSGSDRVALLRAHQRLANHFAALVYRDMGSIRDVIELEHQLDDDPESALAAEAEIRAALSWSRRRAEGELSFALEVRERHPDVLRSLERGLIDVPRAKAICRGTSHVPHHVAREIVSSVLGDAPSLTVGQIDARIRRLALEADVENARRRTEAARERRRVELEPTPDGTANVLAMDLAPADAAAVTRRIARLARQARSANDPRTPDQVRADAFVDIILGRHGGAGTGEAAAHGGPDIEIRVDLTTLMGLDDSPADLGGFGPVISEIARDAASVPGARWAFTVTDPATGRHIASGPVRRRPTASVKRSVRSANPTCVFPGCRTPASDCDLDHTRAWTSGGSTDEANLAPLCRHDHRVKSLTGWRYERRGDGGIVWTSPLGRTYEQRRPPP